LIQKRWKNRLLLWTFDSNWTIACRATIVDIAQNTRANLLDALLSLQVRSPRRVFVYITETASPRQAELTNIARMKETRFLLRLSLPSTVECYCIYSNTHDTDITPLVISSFLVSSCRACWATIVGHAVPWNLGQQSLFPNIVS
jgi:hypothetical protein